MKNFAAVSVRPGEHYVTMKPDEMIVTVLGSCVAACIRDPVARVGGMNHFMLPESQSGAWGVASASLRFGNFAMERLINDILRRGGHRKRLEVKVFGGAEMHGGGGAKVGPRNADFVHAYLRAEGLKVVAEHLRGIYARKVQYFPLSGRARLLELGSEAKASLAQEASYRASLRQEPASGSAELF